MDISDPMVTWAAAFMGALVANITGIREIKADLARLRRYVNAIGRHAGVAEKEGTDP